MNCPRCKSVWGWERYFGGSAWVDSVHCPKCGETIDPVILENRKNHRPTEKGDNRGPHKRRDVFVAEAR